MSAQPAGLVVEVLGAPGTGKSGLAAALGELDGVIVVKDHQRSDLSTLAWSMARAWPVAAVPMGDVDRLRWAAWSARVGAAPALAARRLADGASTVVFDQGAAYTLVRMARLRAGNRPHNRAWWWRRSLETARLLDLLVLLDADSDRLADRVLARRKDHHAASMPPAVLRDYLTGERRGCHQVADVLGREGAEVRRIVTTSVNLEEQVAIVRQALDRHLAHQVR